MFFRCLHFLQKNRTKNSRQVVKSNLFVRFLEEMSAWKNHFEFVWLLKNSLFLKDSYTLLPYVFDLLTNNNYEAVLRLYCKLLHSLSKCFAWVAWLWSEMPMFQRAGIREAVLPLPPFFQFVILMTWRACDLNLVMISSMASKCPHFKLRGLQFHFIKWHYNFKVLAFWGHWSYHDKI